MKIEKSAHLNQAVVDIELIKMAYINIFNSIYNNVVIAPNTVHILQKSDPWLLHPNITPTKFLRLYLFDLPKQVGNGHAQSIKLNRKKVPERKAEIRDAIRIIIIAAKS